MITFVRLMRVLLLLVLTALTISLVIGLARPETGPTEKVVLVGLIAGCIYFARLVEMWASRLQEVVLRP